VHGGALGAGGRMAAGLGPGGRPRPAEDHRAARRDLRLCRRARPGRIVQA